jgi:hypothetical protein
MQTIINPYHDLLNTIPNPQTEGEYQLRASYKTMMLAFNDGVKAAQQAPIVIQKTLKDIAKPFQRMKGCWCLGYRVEIEECEHIFKLRIMQGQKLAYQKDYVDVESLKIFGANFLSSLVTTELGHPVKFELC